MDEYYYEDTPSRVRNSKNQSVVSFGFSDSIYVLSEKDTLRIEAKSGHSKEFRPFDPKEEANMTYIEEYFVEETRYYRIIFDGYRNLYYRVVLHGIPYRNGDGTKNLYQDKPFSILILNENFQTLCEYSFPAKTYDFRNMVVTNEGLWISTGNDLNPASPQNALEYELFQIDID